MDKLLIGLTTLRPGQIPASRDVTLTITPGEGRARLDPDQSPNLGTISAGRLVLESESFPRFAPLTLTLTGADLCFRVRDRRLIRFNLRDGSLGLLRLYCTGILRAAYLYRLFQPSASRLVVTRVNTVSEDCDENALKTWNSPDVSCRTVLQMDVLDGEVATSPDYETGAGDLVEYGLLQVRRNSEGVLKVRLHGARMECDLANGNLLGLRVHDSRGTISSHSFLDASGAGITASVAVVDTLP